MFLLFILFIFNQINIKLKFIELLDGFKLSYRIIALRIAVMLLVVRIKDNLNLFNTSTATSVFGQNRQKK
jgi:hypothetical protein